MPIFAGLTASLEWLQMSLTVVHGSDIHVKLAVQKIVDPELVSHSLKAISNFGDEPHKSQSVKGSVKKIFIRLEVVRAEVIKWENIFFW